MKVVFALDPGMSAGTCLMADDGRFWSGPVEIGNAEDLIRTRKQIEALQPTEVITEAVAWKASAYKKCPKYHSGVLIGALGLQNLPLSFVGPRTWRKAILGDAGAGKKEAMAWVRDRYDYECASHDEAEAVCLAHYAHYHQGQS